MFSLPHCSFISASFWPLGCTTINSYAPCYNIAFNSLNSCLQACFPIKSVELTTNVTGVLDIKHTGEQGVAESAWLSNHLPHGTEQKQSRRVANERKLNNRDWKCGEYVAVCELQVMGSSPHTHRLSGQATLSSQYLIFCSTSTHQPKQALTLDFTNQHLSFDIYAAFW